MEALLSLIGIIFVILVYLFLIMLLLFLIVGTVSVTLYIITGDSLEDWFFEWRLKKDDE